jgi:hypothetical protein
MKRRTEKLNNSSRERNKSKDRTMHKKASSFEPFDLSNLEASRTGTPDLLDKIIKLQNKNVEVGKSLEESIGMLPPVYHQPLRAKFNSPQLLTIMIPELAQHASGPRKATSKLPKYFKVKRKRSITPLSMKNIQIDGALQLPGSRGHKYIKGIKLLYFLIFLRMWVRKIEVDLG